MDAALAFVATRCVPSAGLGGGTRTRCPAGLTDSLDRSPREDNVRLYSVLLGCLSRREDLEGSRRVLGGEWPEWRGADGRGD